ncbi:MAG: peptidoglycan bridge formation glycyltransferase FemA/FemB family protein [Pirellulaceae bacterium]
MKNWTIRPFETLPDWDAFVRDHRRGSIYHTAAMCRALQATKDFQLYAKAACDADNQIRAIVVSARISTMKKLGKYASRCVMFAEPLCCDSAEGSAALQRLLHDHDASMKRRALFTEIRPLFGDVESQRSRESEAMMDAGYTRLGYNNYELDLSASEEQLWRGIDTKTRGDIRRSERRGVTIRKVPLAEGLDVLYAHLQASYGHSKIPLVDKSLFIAAARELSSDQIETRIADYQGVPIASGCNLLFGDRIVYWYAGVVRTKGIAANSCLLWTAIQEGAANGYKIFDFAGAGWVGEDYGPGKFKANFGGELVEYGRYRRIYSKWSMWAAAAAYDWSRRWLSPKQVASEQLASAVARAEETIGASKP